jgi:4-diphosphocytidyl-2-C-methyl-D-erythritol kinase
MMVGLNRLFDLKRDTQTLVALSGALGSDVGFLIAALGGTPSAIVTGKGERLEAQTPGEITHLVLIFPPFGCPTAEVYKTLDAQRAGLDVSHLPDVSRVRALAKASPVPQDAPFNDLAAPACAVQPRLGEMLAELRAKLALPVHVTGSGAAMFVIAPTAITARALTRKVTALTGLPAVATRTL